MATKKFPPFLGRETPSEERKEMKVKKQSPALYKMAEKAEGVHGKSGTMKPSKYASGGAIDSAPKRAPRRGPPEAGAGDVTPPQEMRRSPPPKYASGGMVPDKKRMGSGAMGKGPGYAKGGGIERKGRTQGTAIKMRGGGKC
jgi:hypothetical protein